MSNCSFFREIEEEKNTIFERKMKEYKREKKAVFCDVLSCAAEAKICFNDVAKIYESVLTRNVIIIILLE